MQRRPQVDHVPLLAALLVKALKDVGLQVDAERAAPAVAAMIIGVSSFLREK
jgi:hypothetical protein